MKKIIKICIILSALIVFFTGCSSLAGSIEVDSGEIRESVAESEGMNTTAPQGIKEQAPDYFAQNMQEKFLHADAPRAFQLKDEHSQEIADMESFQIGALLPDKTFIYGYSTRIRESAKPRDMVHCAAWYNYERRELMVFHENRFGRDWEDEEEKAAANAEDKEEAFFIQVYDADNGEKEIFIYDNGEGYIYRMDGSVKLHVDIAGFVQNQYPNVYSVSIIHAVTDGENRFYLEVSIEKEPVNVAPEDEAADENPVDPEDTEEEIEALDKETQDKLESVILVYEVHSLAPTLYQENERFQEQVDAWKAKAEGLSFEEDSLPDDVEDWEKVLEALPDMWGGTRISNMEDLPVYEWKNDAEFLSEDGICTFVPNPQAYTPFVDVVKDWEFWKQFIPYQGHYSRLYGTVGNVTYAENETFTRTFTKVWTETTTNEEGNEVSEEKSEEITQSLTLNTRNRSAPLQNAYIESYWTLDKTVGILGNAVGKDILCSNDQGEAYWILPGGELEKIGSFPEDQQLWTMQDGDSAFLLSSDQEKMQIQTDKRHTAGGEKDVQEVIPYQNLSEVARPGDSVYDQFFQEKNEEKIAGGFNGYGGIYLTKDQIVPAALSLNASLVSQLRAFGEDVFMPSGRGYLLTLPNKGLIYYDILVGKSLTLLEGNWYGTWKQGNQMISIGFSGTSSYGEIDIAFSRVYAYELGEMVTSAMRDTLQAYQEQRQKEQESERAKAQEEMTRESVDPLETVEDMAEQWNREHPPEKRQQAASEALEELFLPEESEE